MDLLDLKRKAEEEEEKMKEFADKVLSQTDFDSFVKFQFFNCTNSCGFFNGEV